MPGLLTFSNGDEQYDATVRIIWPDADADGNMYDETSSTPVTRGTLQPVFIPWDGPYYLYVVWTNNEHVLSRWGPYNSGDNIAMSYWRLTSTTSAPAASANYLETQQEYNLSEPDDSDD